MSAWLTYRSLPDNDPRRTEIEQIVFDLVERGSAPPDSRAADWPWGTGTTPGFAIGFGAAGDRLAAPSSSIPGPESGSSA